MWWDTVVPWGKYGFEIDGDIGKCIKSNSGKFAVGDIILSIEKVQGNVFFGKQIFTDGHWYDVSGRLEHDALHMSGGGWKWQMKRIAVGTPL